MESYFHQNHPIVTELSHRHRDGELTFVGTIATTSSLLEDDRRRNCVIAAQLAGWNLKADGVILTKYSGGAPHADMIETAGLCENLGIKTVIMPSDMAPDRRAESALLFSAPEIDAIVSHSEGAEIAWQVPAATRVIAGNPNVAAAIAPAQELTLSVICGIPNNQGGSRLQSIPY